MKNPWKVVAVALGVAFSVVVAEGRFAQAEPEPEAHMRAALDALRAAERQLEKSSQDDAGHRGRALTLTKDAIDQLEKAVSPRRGAR